MCMYIYIYIYIYDKAVNTSPSPMQLVPKGYKTQQTCNKVVSK